MNRRMKPLNPFFAALSSLVVVAPTMAFADVIINEFGAANSERNLRSHPDGRPRLGWGPSWSELSFDASDWSVGTSPFGYNNEGIATDVAEAMDGRTGDDIIAYHSSTVQVKTCSFSMWLIGEDVQRGVCRNVKCVVFLSKICGKNIDIPVTHDY